MSQRLANLERPRAGGASDRPHRRRTRARAGRRCGSRDGSIADHALEDLAARMGRPGLPRNHETPRVLAAGMRAVVYFWIDLTHAPAHSASPRHRVGLIAFH